MSVPNPYFPKLPFAADVTATGAEPTTPPELGKVNVEKGQKVQVKRSDLDKPDAGTAPAAPALEPIRTIVSQKSEEEKKAEDPRAGQVYTAEDIQKAQERQRRLEIGAAAYKRPTEALSENEKRISQAISGIVMDRAAEVEKQLKASGVTKTDSILSEKEKETMARIHWEMQIKNPSYWRTLNRANKAIMMEFFANKNESWNEMRDKYGPQESWWDALKHGAIAYGKSAEYAGVGFGAYASAMKTMETARENSKINDLKRNSAQTNFFRILKDFKKNPEIRDKKKVDGLYEKFLENPELLDKQGLIKDPEIHAAVKSLNEAEATDLFLRLNHRKKSDKFGKDAPPVTLDDFDLDQIPDKYDYNKESLDSAFISRVGISAERDPISGANLALFEQAKKEEAAFAVRNARTAKTKKGYIDPVSFIEDNVGKGIFRGVKTDVDEVATAQVAATYGYLTRKIEGGIAGAAMLGYQLFGAGEDPHTWAGRIKRYLAYGASAGDIDSLISWYDAAQTTNEEMRAWSQGERSVGARLVSAFSPYTTEEVQAYMFKHGFLNDEAINVGMMKVMPSAIIGRASVISRAGTASGLGVIGTASVTARSAAKMGLISVDRYKRIQSTLMKAGMKAENFEKAFFGAPVKLIGAVTLGTGKTVVYAGGAMFQGISNVASKMLQKVAPEIAEGLQSTASRKALSAIGVTSAFHSLGVLEQIAGLYGVGAAAEAAGGLLYKYGYRGTNASGRMFAGALADASKDMELSAASRFMAKAGNFWGGVPAAALYDFTKGGWHGGGVALGLGFVQDGKRGAINGFWGGVGMGGAGAVHATIQQYRAGVFTHSIAENELKKMMKDATDKAGYEDLITRANELKDWTLLPMAVGAIKMAGLNNIKVVAFNENNLPDLGVEILREERMDPNDYTVMVPDANGNRVPKKFLIESMKLAAQQARERAAQLSANAKTEADFAQAEQASKLAEKAEIDLHNEFNDWLSSVRQNGTADQKSRVRTATTLFNGVHIDGGVGNGVIYVNTGLMKNSTIAHELFHGVQLAVYRSQAMNHFANQVFGIRILNGTVVAQEGAVQNLEMLKQFSELYIDVLYSTPVGADPATVARDEGTRRQKVDELHAAFDLLSKDQSGLDIKTIENAHEILRKAAEEFGANYFEAFLERQRPDYLFKQGKYSAIRRILNSVENYIDHSISLDVQGDGINLQAQRTLDNRKSAEFAEKLNKINVIKSNVFRLRERLASLRVVTKRDPQTGEIIDYHYKDKKAADAIERLIERNIENYNKIESSLGKRDIGDVFRDASGAHLVIPAVDKMLKRMIERMDQGVNASNPLDLSSLPPQELQSVLRRAGLTHFLDANGRLKSQQQINAEAVDRGKKALAVLQALGPLSGMVVHTDETGTRASGLLTKEGIDALVKADAILPHEAKNAMAILEAIKTAMGVGTLSGSAMDLLYHGLSHEKFLADGSVGTDRKPRNIVDPTYRRIVPYRMDFVMTSKGADGNKVEPHFELMVTALDLNVLLANGTENFNASYTLPSGKVIRAADLFGGSFDVFKHHLQRYLASMSQANAPAGADLFGGGETGAAIRDIMYKTVGAIKGTTGKDNAGNPLLINNPIISPFKPSTRGPNFVFTTFRVDLMSDLSVKTDRWSFNERYAYPRVQNNYSPVAFGEMVTLKSGVSELRATHSFDVAKNAETGETQTVSSNYRIYQKNADRRFYITSDVTEFGKTKEYNFGTAEEAKRFVSILAQRHMLAAQNKLSSTFMGGDSGIVVSNIDGNYVLMDTNNNYRIVQGGKVYSDQNRAVIAATLEHNAGALLKLSKSKNKRNYELAQRLVGELKMNGASDELLMPRLQLKKDGTPKIEVVKSGKKVVKYKQSDPEVKAGLAKVGDPKMKLALQKVNYNLMLSLLGNQTLRMGDPVVQRSAEQVGNRLMAEAIEAAKDPEIRKALGWYRSMVKSGYSVFGSMYGLFTESLGATSARTDVEQNFIQAEEAVAMFSQGKYDSILAKIHSEIDAIQQRIDTKDANGVSTFEAEAVRLQLAKKALEAVIDQFDFNSKDYDINDFLSKNTEDGLTQEHFDAFDKAMAEAGARRKKERLSREELSEAARLTLSAIFRKKENLMLRGNGKKYNANTVKVGQVLYGMWRELTDGPKTPNFAGNLEGTTREATIDVWAARTLHRIINESVLKRQRWRLSAGMETGVDYAWHDNGSTDNPNIEVGGDFGFGQLIFRKALEGLKASNAAEFKDLAPDDLQALMWFAEKKLWANRGWTEGAGAEMSSFEQPMESLSGSMDPNGVEGWSNLRRFIAGFTGNYGPESMRVKVNGVPIDASGVARNTAQPEKALGMVKSMARKALGESLRALNVNQTNGLYGGYVEHSISFDALVRRGRAAEVQSLAMKASSKLDSARAKMEAAAEADLNADAASKKETGKKLREARNAYSKAKAEADKFGNMLTAEQTNPTVKNQLGLVAEGFIELARNYLQKDVMVGETVGPNHPNARPAVDIMFEQPMTLAEIGDLVKAITGTSDGVLTGFTAIPDPRNTNVAKITEITRRMNAMVDSDGNPLPQHKEAYKRLEAEYNSLRKFKGIQAQANPEMTYRYRSYNSNPKIKGNQYDLLTESGARAYMADWRAVFTNAKPLFEIYNGNKLTFNEYHVSTETIASGGYDTFNPADIGGERSLGDRLRRYERDLGRELASLEEQSQGRVGSADSPAYTPDRTAWRSTDGTETALSRRENALGDDGAGAVERGETGPKAVEVLSATEAKKWVEKAFANPYTGTNNEAGMAWGDKDYTIYQKRGADGTLSQEFWVMNVNDRKPTVVTGREAAISEVTARLTGQKQGQAGERVIKVNGVEFNVTEGMRPVISPTGKLIMEYGAFGPKDDIWSFSPTANVGSARDPFGSVSGIGDVHRKVLHPNGRPTGYLFSDKAEEFLGRLNLTLGQHTVPRANGETTFVRIIDETGGAEHVDSWLSGVNGQIGDIGLVKTQQTITPKIVFFPSRQGYLAYADPAATGSASIYTAGGRTLGSQDVNIKRIFPAEKNPQNKSNYLKIDASRFGTRFDEAATRQLLAQWNSYGSVWEMGPMETINSVASEAHDKPVQTVHERSAVDSDLKLRTSDDGSQFFGSTLDKAKVGMANVMSGQAYYGSTAAQTNMINGLKALVSRYKVNDQAASITGLNRSGNWAINNAIEKFIQDFEGHIFANSDGTLNSSASDQAAHTAAIDMLRKVEPILRNGGDPLFVAEAQKVMKTVEMLTANLSTVYMHYGSMRVKGDIASVRAVSDAFRGAGSAINGENAARLQAMGVGTPDSQGVQSFIVNKTGAVYKTRRNTYGEGNTVFTYSGKTEQGRPVRRSHTSTDVAVAETVELQETGNITSFIQKNKQYSPAGQHIPLERAFGNEPDSFGYTVASKANGGLFSKRAQAALPDEIEIHTKVDSAGNIHVKAVDSLNHNWIKGEDGSRKNEGGVIMDFKLMVGRKYPKKEAAGISRPSSEYPPNGEVTITGMWRPRKDPLRNSWNDDVSQKTYDESGELIAETDTFESYFDKRTGQMESPEPRATDPKIESAVIGEVVERLRQAGIKSIGEDSFDATRMYDQITQAMHGKAPNKFKSGWEADEPYWKIDPKKEYSPASGNEPAFVGIDRVFGEVGITADTLYSKTARARLGDYTIDFETVRDEELRQGMDSDQTGANRPENLKNPLAIVRINEKSGRKETAAEFFLMPVIEKDRGMTYGHAVLQMTGKKKHVREETLVGVLSEITERLRMTGIRQIFVPRKAWEDMAMSKRKVLEKLQQELKDSGVEGEVDVPDAKTVVDEHDGLSIILGQYTPLTTSGGPVHIYHIDRKKQYSPAAGGAEGDPWANPEIGRAVADRGRNLLAGLGYGAKHKFDLLPDRLKELAIEYQGLADILDKDEYYDFTASILKTSPNAGALVGTKEALKKRLAEIVHEFARHRGYLTELEHNSRSGRLEGPVKGAYEVLGVNLYAGLKDDPSRMTSGSEFGAHHHNMVMRGEQFDYTSHAHRARLEQAMDDIIATGDWRHPLFPTGYNLGPTIGDARTLTGKKLVNAIVGEKGHYSTFEIIGRRFKLKEAMQAAGFTGYREHEMRQGTFENDAGPHVAIYGSESVKLKDNVTYDKDGKVVPIHLRFDRTNPDVRFSPVDLSKHMPDDRSASPVTDPNENPEGFLYHVTLANLDQIKKRGLRSNAFFNAYDPETGDYLDNDGVEDKSRQVIWFAASERESNDNVRGGHTFQLRIKESKLAEYADLTDAEREGSGAGFIAEGGSKPWAIRPEFLEYRIIDSKKYEGTGDWLPVAGPPSKKKGKGNGK